MNDPQDATFATKVQSLPLQTFREAACEAAKIGGAELMRLLGVAQVELKGPRDLVTQADFASQAAIREYLQAQFSDHDFIGEEDLASRGLPNRSDATEKSNSDFCWVVDPLDGTTNFVHQLPSFSVSVALQFRGRSIAAAVWDPTLEELYSAAFGQGSTCNERSLQVSDCQKIGRAMFIISLSRGVTRNDVQISQFMNLLEGAGTIRRLGSAALNLCYVGHGRVDGYWATRLSPWDVAAGSLVATEAGAVLRCLDGSSYSTTHPEFLCTSSDELFGEAQRVLLDGDDR